MVIRIRIGPRHKLYGKVDVYKSAFNLILWKGEGNINASIVYEKC